MVDAFIYMFFVGSGTATGVGVVAAIFYKIYKPKKKGKGAKGAVVNV